MKQILILLLLLIVMVTACGTATEYRKVQHLKTGAVTVALFMKRDSKQMLRNDKSWVQRQTGGNRWIQSFGNVDNVTDTVRVEYAAGKRAKRVEYSLVKIID